MHWILMDERLQGSQTTTKARLCVKNKVKSTNELSSKVRGAVKSLASAGLVTLDDEAGAEDAGSSQGRKAKGHPVLSFRKRAWSEIEGNENATDLLKRLRIGADAFS